MEPINVSREELEQDITIAYWEREREIWLEARVNLAVEPCGEHREAVRRSAIRLDYLMDDYNGSLTNPT